MSLSFQEVLNADPVMAGLIARVGPLDFKPRRLPPFQSLTRAVMLNGLLGGANVVLIWQMPAKNQSHSPNSILIICQRCSTTDVLQKL